MIPMAVNGSTATLRHATEVSDGYGVIRQWEDVCTVFATVNPSASAQTATEDGMESTEEAGIFFCHPSEVSVYPDDRLVVGDAVYRLMTVTDFQGSVSARGVRVYERGRQDRDLSVSRYRRCEG